MMDRRWVKRASTGLVVVFAFSGSLLVAQTTGISERIIQNHLQFIPSGNGPFPTLIAFPGCSGIAFQDSMTESTNPDVREDDRLFRRHYPRAAERLSTEGYPVLLINVHAAEGLVTACNGEIQPELIARYINEAVAWAAGLNFVDATRLHVIGWSMGGRGLLAWFEEPQAQSSPVRSAISVYAGCQDRDPLTNPVPLLMLLGDADDIADASMCEELVARPATETVITLRRYPGARHGYDVPEAPEALDIGNGRTIGYQQAAAEASWREILAFLMERE